MPEGRGGDSPLRSHGAFARDAGRSGIARQLPRGSPDRSDRLRGTLLPARAAAAERRSGGALSGACRRCRAWTRTDTRCPGIRRSLGRGIRAANTRGARRHRQGALRPDRMRVRGALTADRRGVPHRRRRGPRPVLCRHSRGQRARSSIRAPAVPSEPIQASVLRLHHGRLSPVLLRLCEGTQRQPHRGPDAARPRRHEEGLPARLHRVSVEQAGGRAGRAVRTGGGRARRDLSPAADGAFQYGLYPGDRFSVPPVRRGDTGGKGAAWLVHSTQRRAGRYRQRDLRGDLPQPLPALHGLPPLRSPAALRGYRGQRLRDLLGKRFLPGLQAFVPGAGREFSAAGPVGPGRPFRALLVQRGQDQPHAAHQRPRHPGRLSAPDQVAGAPDPPCPLLRLGQAAPGRLALSGSRRSPGPRSPHRSGKCLRRALRRLFREHLSRMDARRARAAHRCAAIAGSGLAGTSTQSRGLRAHPIAAQQRGARPRTPAASRNRTGRDRAARLHRRNQPHRDDPCCIASCRAIPASGRFAATN